MELNTSDYQGKNRRKNGLRFTTGDWIKIIIIVATVITTGIVGWTNLKAQVENNGEEIVEIEEKHNEDVKEINGSLKTLIELVQAQAVMNGKIQTSIEYIQKDIEEIKNK